MGQITGKTTAQQIANDLGLSGSYWPVIIQALIGLSLPVRKELLNYFQAQKSYYNTYRNSFVHFTRKGDILAEQIQAAAGALNLALQPLTNFLNVMPIDSALKEIPEFSEMLSELSKSVPLKIPATAATQLTGIAGFDFLEGVSSFQDLKDKIDELLFRAARAVSLSNYASQATYMVDLQVDKINKYLDILITLDYRGL